MIVENTEENIQFENQTYMRRYAKMDLGEIAYEGVDWFHLAQDALQ
jgi:hypothetical protein